MLRARGASRRLAAAILTVGIATFGCMTAAPAAPAGFAVHPVSPDPADPTPPSYFTLSLAAGRSTTQRVVVSNPTGSPVHLAVDGVDGRTAETSGAVYANRHDVVTEAGAWVAPASRTITLPPHSDASVAFTVTVPEGTTPGDHLAGLAVENTDPTKSGSGFQVEEVVRTVVGVLVKVPGPAAFVPRILSAGLTELPGPGVVSVVVRLADDGLALGKPNVRITLSGSDGYTRTLARDLDTLLPGDTIDYPFAWPDSLAAGDYSITVWFTGGGMTVEYTTKATLRDATRGVRALRMTPVTSSAADGGGFPWWTVILVILAGIVTGAFLCGRRAGRAHPDPTCRVGVVVRTPTNPKPRRRHTAPEE